MTWLTYTIILLAVALVATQLYLLFFLYRNRQVYEARKLWIDLCSDYGHRHLTDEDYESPYEWFWPKAPSYREMLFSFRPLRLDEWFSKEDLERLLS